VKNAKGKQVSVDHMHLKITDNWAKCAGCTEALFEEE
jgi:hypothetical protein